MSRHILYEVKDYRGTRFFELTAEGTFREHGKKGVPKGINWTDAHVLDWLTANDFKLIDSVVV